MDICYPVEEWRRLCFFFPDYHCFELTRTLQFDGFQCGVWVCWTVNRLVSVDGIPWSAPFLMNVLLNFASARVRDGGARLVEECRTSFVNSLQRAASSGSLLVSYSDAVAAAPSS